MSTVINRHEGQDRNVPEGAAYSPWDIPGDAGQAHVENLAALSSTHPEPSGDPLVHVPIHLRFLMSPLGQAMPKRQRERLIQHVLGHLAAALALSDSDEAGVALRPMEKAARLASMELAYRNGSGV